MRLHFATEDFVYGGLARPGFPLLTDDDFGPLEPFQSFLFDELLNDGAALKVLTWRAIGERLWDYAAYLGAQGIQWDAECSKTGMGPVVRYRDWSRSPEQSVGISTLNDRLAVVLRLYGWALRTRRIERLPFDPAELKLSPESAPYEHYPNASRRRGLRPLETPSPLAFITRPQVAVIRKAQLHPTHRLMFEMVGRTGMRSSEVRTFPADYVFNPELRPGLSPSGAIRIELRPDDMELKFDKGRTIDVPYSLMKDMHAYASFYRDGLLREGHQEAPLLLTARGRPFDKDAVVGAFAGISAATGIHVRAHLMRHTFAIYFLLKLRSIPDYKGNPLEHLMNQLGHSNINSVMVYLKHIGIADNATNLAIQEQLDDIFTA